VTVARLVLVKAYLANSGNSENEGERCLYGMKHSCVHSGFKSSLPVNRK